MPDVAASLAPRHFLVKFKDRRFDHFIDRHKFDLPGGTPVIVQAERGRDLGIILFPVREGYLAPSRRYPLEILKKASEDDLRVLEENRRLEKEALAQCRELIWFRGLDMKLVDAEYQWDRTKLTFYFTSEHRVDFRELVKDLAATFRTRIELRQIGVRDEARMRGGYGPCGQELCCSRFLKKFDPVSTQFAKDQNLFVNPAKLSGVCGRLMCCLVYEEELYKELSQRYPIPGDVVEMNDGKAVVEQVNYFADKITLRYQEDERGRILSLAEFKRNRKGGRDFLEKWKK
ncbi:hypothetical protein J7K18_05175 [bacterium]|nr:hypothetical protein [bacterium]